MTLNSLSARRAFSKEVYDALNRRYPDVGTFLTHESPFQLLIAVILSAQCTDERVNIVTPALFKEYATAPELAEAPLESVKTLIKSINFFNNKSQNIIKTSQILVRDYQGEVPVDLESLVGLPGVGRKTANVVRGQAFNLPGITVDTHVNRVTNRLGFIKEKDPVKAEFDLMKVWDNSMWTDFSSTLILHGRQVCKARAPQCDACQFSQKCPASTQVL